MFYSHQTRSSIQVLACLWVLVSGALAQLNPEVIPYDPYYPSPPPPCCETCLEQDAGDASCSNLPPCPTNGSVFFSVGLGRTAFVRDTSYTSAMTKAGKAVYLSSAAPKSIFSESAFNRKSPLTGYRNFYLWYHEQSLTAASFEPSALVADPGANCERILIGTTPRQIMTKDYFADIQPLANVRDNLPNDIKSTSEIPAGAPGFVIRTWFASEPTAKVDGLYGIPSTEIAPLGYVVFYRKAETSTSTPPAWTKTLGIIHRIKSSSSTYKTQSWLHLNDNLGNWTSTHYRDLPSGNVKLGRTTRTVTSRTSANKYTLTQSDEEAALTDTGGLGSLVEVSNSEEEFDDIGGLKRLVRRTLGANLPTAKKRTTRYGWVNAPTNSAIHGRPQWEFHPDGSFVHHTYSYSVGGTSGSIVTRRPWKTTSWTPGATAPANSGCVVETTSFTSSTMTVTRQVNGATLISSEESAWSTEGSLNVHAHKVRYGANTTDVLTTTTAYYGPSDGDQANRIAWRIRQDGTAETYRYVVVPNVPENYNQTVEVGQGASTGITQGRRTVSTRNSRGFVIDQHEYWFKTGTGATTVSLSSWAVDSVPSLAAYDFLGRPQGKVHNGNTNDYEATMFGCCGLAYQRDRSGKVTEYFQDELHRQYKQIETTGSVVETTTTARAAETSFAGMVTETRRSDGTLNLLVNKSWVTTNGELERTQSPDANNDGAAEETTYTHSYPGSGHSVSVAHSDGGTSETTYFADGRTQSVSGTAVADSSYDYQPHTEQGGGIVTTHTSGSTTEWTQTYTDLAGRTFKIEYPTTLNAPPAFDNVTITYHLHDAAAGSRGRTASSTDPDGVTTTYTHSGEGKLYQVTEPMPGSVGNRVTETLHDGFTHTTLGGSLRTITKVNNVTVSTSLQSGDGYRALQDSFGVETLTERTVASGGDWTETTTHPDLTRTRRIYDNGRLQSVQKRDNTNADDDLGNLISYVSYTYDGLGRMLTSADSRTGTTNYTSYTASGNLLSQTEPGTRITIYEYDKMGRRTLVDQPNTDIEGGTAENKTRTSYYLTGTVEAIWGDQTNATFHLYDEENRITELRAYRSLAHNTKPTSSTGGEDATKWSYHSQRGWLTAKEYPDGQDSGAVRDPGPSYTYTAAGRMKTRTWGGGKRTRYDYRQGLLVATRHFLIASEDTGTNAGTDAQTPDVGQSYNNRGQPVDVITTATTAHPGTCMLYSYDGDNFRITQEMQQVDPDVTFSLGADSTGITITAGTVPPTITRSLHRKAGAYLRNTGADLREGPLVTNTLNIGSTLAYGTTDGRFLSVTGDFVGSTGTYTYGYQASSTSNLIDTITGPVHAVDNQWLGDRDALDWKKNMVDTDTVSKYDYSVNAISQRDSVSATSTVGTFGTVAPDWNWLYNVRGELVSSQHVNTGASSRHYTFDGNGNRSEHRDGTHTTTGGTAKAYTPNALNQYNAIGALSPGYNLDGNMTTGPLPAVPTANSSLVWNGNNQLIEVTPSGGSTVKYHYDALGRRVARTIGSTRTYWFYDGWNLVAEFMGAVHTTEMTAPAVTLEKTWLWGTDLSGTLQGAGGVGGLLAATLETGDYPGIYHPLYDGNGNIGQYLDSYKVAVAKYEYDGFGNTVVSSGTHKALFSHRFSTKPLDAETGLYDYGYRWYDPLTGRWPSRDPVRERGGVNLYGFVGNDSIKSVDLLGMEEAPWNRPDRTDITRKEFEEWLKKAGKPISEKTSNQLDNGCVGLCGIMVNAEYFFEKPEDTGGVKCYLEEPDAVKHECPKGTRKQIFAKQGKWKFASGPRPGTDGTVPNDSVVGNGGPDKYNYVTRIVLTNGKVKYMWMNHSTRQPDQMVTFADGPPPDPDYPRIMWCTKCIKCMKGEGKEIPFLP